MSDDAVSKAYVIPVFARVLLGHNGFLPLFYPETQGFVGPNQLGYYKKTHSAHILLSPAVSTVFAYICSDESQTFCSDQSERSVFYAI